MFFTYVNIHGNEDPLRLPTLLYFLILSAIYCTPISLSSSHAFFFSSSVYSSDEDDDDVEIYDHDYDGPHAKTGKRHLGKTRWTREEVCFSYKNKNIILFIIMIKRMLFYFFVIDITFLWSYFPIIFLHDYGTCT